MPNLPANCPFTNSGLGLNFVSGSAVFYGTQNKNGQWGGVNAVGTGAFSQGDTTLYTGQLHVWGGNGNNNTAQTTSGFTLSFQGTGTLGTLDIHINGQTTTNAGGTTTVNFQNITITCS